MRLQDMHVVRSGTPATLETLQRLERRVGELLSSTLYDLAQ